MKIFVRPIQRPSPKKCKTGLPLKRGERKKHPYYRAGFVHLGNSAPIAFASFSGVLWYYWGPLLLGGVVLLVVRRNRGKPA
jgi:hypothetical protein